MVYEWTTANFEGYPIQTDKIGQVYLRVQDTRKAVAERIRNEHYLVDGLDADHGRHNTGSARSFVFRGTGPTGVPAAADAGTTDFSQGRVALSVTGAELSRDYKLFVYEAAYGADAAGWKGLSYVSKTDTETVAGEKTFSSLPKTITTTPWGTAVDADVLPKKVINDYLVSQTFKSMIGDVLIPVGFAYVQYPNTLEPATIYAAFGWTWDDITVNFGGAFFRAYLDGISGAFTMTHQTQELLAHTHAITPTNATKLDGLIGPGLGADYTSGVTHYPVNDVTTAAITASTGGAELRPDNLAIKIWKRTV